MTGDLYIFFFWKWAHWWRHRHRLDWFRFQNFPSPVVEIWFGIANGQISSIFDGYLPETRQYFCFRTITWVNNKGFSPNLLYALTLRRSGLRLLMGRFHQIFTELSAWDTPIFSFPDDNLVNNKGFSSNAASLGGSVGCAVQLEIRRSRVQPPPRATTFFRGDWSWNIFYGHSLPCRPRWLSWMRRPTGIQEVAGSTPAEVGNILS